MKRFHIHISVDDLKHSLNFYSAMFGADPAVKQPDYVKWVLDDPCVNFAISQKPDRKAGLNHIGIQAETEAELEGLYAQLGDASITTLEQEGAKCCYAESDKHWAIDPSGVVWEMFLTMNEIAVYGDDRASDLDPLATPGL